jgi:uncharacterized protein YgfB (UPF0149 family)
MNRWQELVIKHTKNGACNFQAAADEMEEFYEAEIKRLHSHYHSIISKQDQRIFDLEDLLDSWLAKALRVRDKSFMALAVETEEMLK